MLHSSRTLASMILLGSYEATFAVAAVIARERGCRVKLVLTKVGGGVFGNRSNWIIEAIQHSIKEFRDHPLDVELLHYGAAESLYVKGLKQVG